MPVTNADSQLPAAVFSSLVSLAYFHIFPRDLISSD